MLWHMLESIKIVGPLRRLIRARQLPQRRPGRDRGRYLRSTSEMRDPVLELSLQHIQINLYVSVCDLVDNTFLELVVHANNQVGRSCGKLERHSTHVACKDRFRHVAARGW